MHVVVCFATRRTVGFGVVHEAAILAFTIHQDKARGVPQFVAEVAIALAALAVEIDTASQTGQGCEGEAQGISAVSGNALWKFFLGVFAHLRGCFGFAQTLAAFVQQRFKRNAVNQVHGVQHIALGLAHLLALRVTDQTVDVDMFERYLAGEMRGHHDHAGDPKEDDVVACDQDTGGQVQVCIQEFVARSVAERRCSVELARVRFAPGLMNSCITLPPQGAERHQSAGVPSVQHVFISAQCFAWRLGLGLGFVVGHIHLAVFVIPSRDLMAPPELTADTPIGDVVHPLVVGVHPVLGHEFHLTGLHCIDGLLRDAFAGGVLRADLVHGDKPLVGQHGFNHLAGAGANRQHQLVGLDLQHQAHGFQVAVDGFAGIKGVHALVGGRTVFIDLGVQREDGDEWQAVTLRTGVVVEVVGAGDLHATRAKFAVHEVIGNDGDLPIAQRQIDHFSYKVFVAFIFGMHSQGTIGHHGFRAGGGDRHAFLRDAVNQLRAIGKRIADVVHLAFRFGALHFQIRHRAHQHRVPIHQALATVNQALLVKLHKGVGHHRCQLVVHREVLARPVHAVAHAAHLLGDGVA